MDHLIAALNKADRVVIGYVGNVKVTLNFRIDSVDVFNDRIVITSHYEDNQIVFIYDNIKDVVYNGECFDITFSNNDMCMIYVD